MADMFTSFEIKGKWGDYEEEDSPRGGGEGQQAPALQPVDLNYIAQAKAISLDQLTCGLVEMVIKADFAVSSGEVLTERVACFRKDGVQVDLTLHDDGAMTVYLRKLKVAGLGSLSSDSEPETEVEVTESEPESEAKHEEADDEWEEVGKRKRNRRRQGRKKLQQEVRWTEDDEFLFFTDEANSDVWDYHGPVKGIAAVHVLAQHHPWCHAFCEAKNVVIDYVKYKKRTFAPNKGYMEQWNRWKEAQEAGKTGDERTFYVIKEAANWRTDEWRLIDQAKGLLAARALAKKEGGWTHCFCPEDQTLIDFCVRNNRFTALDRSHLADGYVGRFEAFIVN